VGDRREQLAARLNFRFTSDTSQFGWFATTSVPLTANGQIVRAEVRPLRARAPSAGISLDDRRNSAGEREVISLEFAA
jgi:hypothetical protein